jgi:hypothetical protein
MEERHGSDFGQEDHREAVDHLEDTVMQSVSHHENRRSLATKDQHHKSDFTRSTSSFEDIIGCRVVRIAANRWQNGRYRGPASFGSHFEGSTHLG